jgi:outer membrane protein with beta-barrel domain
VAIFFGLERVAVSAAGGWALRMAPRLLAALSVAGLAAAGVAHADAQDPRPGRWSGGAGVGFLANSPDGPEPAVAGHAQYFVTERLSVGPLVQYAGVGNDVIVGLSVQVRYWWSILASSRAKLVVQGGVGFVHALIEDSDSGAEETDSSFVVPVGIGIDYAVTDRIAVTADLIVNVTSLGGDVPVGDREVDLHTNMMPGFYLGVRF